MNPFVVAGLLSIADEVAALTVYTVLKKERPRPPKYPSHVRHGEDMTKIVQDYLKQKS